MSVQIVERDQAGRVQTTFFHNNHVVVRRSTRTEKKRKHLLELLAKIFLPSGYPESVNPDYLRFQVFNGLQACCSSVSGLISSRAILEGAGVGNASASATHALLVTILQDIFSRITTIIAAYYIGTSLFPEAKAYRFLADIANDFAITLDVLSPMLNSVSLSYGGIRLRSGSLRIVALCLSGSLRSLCSIAAGGSKTAISTHFATPPTGRGDLGDLNAKDSSIETVLCLMGMLLGTVIIPYLTTPWPTYTILFSLLTIHLIANYIAIRGIAFRTLNRQRAGIAWSTYRQSNNSTILSPAQLAPFEQIFGSPGSLRDAHTGKIVGRCTIGSSLSTIGGKHIPFDLLTVFDSERYILWFDPKNLASLPGRSGQTVHGFLQLHICLKEGHTTGDQLKAWVHAVEVGLLWNRRIAASSKVADGEDEASCVIRTAYHLVEEQFASFIDRMRQVGWNTNDGEIMTGVPSTLLISIEGGIPDSDEQVINEERKDV